MAPSRRVRPPRAARARSSKNTLRKAHSAEVKADQKRKPTDVFDFPDNSDISSIGLNENDKYTEPYETFDPPLYSTVIYADEEELRKHCRSSIPSTPQGKETQRSLDTLESEASGSQSVKIGVKKPGRKLEFISNESESTEESDIRRKVKSAEKISTQHETITTTGSSEHSENSADLATAKETGPHGAQSCVVRETRTTESQPKTQNKGKLSRGKKKKSRSEAIDPDLSSSMHIWCLEGKKTGDIMELDIVLSAFEKIFLEYKQKIESEICKGAINKFHFNIKEQLIKTLKEVQMLKNLKRKNAKIISDIEKKRQRLVEVQDELLRLEPQLMQLQTKYDELKDRKSSLRNVAYFLPSLKQLYQDYSDVQKKEPNVKETYDSSSLPALLFKARTLLGAENHLQNINHQLERLLDQE
ncbi:centromere protein U [Tupaia chinensis]|uniref:centromere protein U n=1 Tax=Tupaia chinensis TaxID=246437 RepID=UPI0003C90A00|nr:centromere protein U [Tupaia chinensis]XP_006160502.1 centromere protein U [Tupaia chinensis]